MKIVHLCLSCFYIDGYSYQENLLPKYHQFMGNEVGIIASLMSFDSNGDRIYLPHGSVYKNECGIQVSRLDFKKPARLSKILRMYKSTYQSIKEFAPDIIFMHGVQFKDVSEVIKYMKKHPNVKLFVDNHSDFSNSATNWISKNIQHKILWRYYAKKLEPYVEKFYGVLPARVDFLINMYGLPKEKVELLVMGADDELVEKAEHPAVKKKIREKCNINQDDFLIMTGGKIDSWKKQTLLLMDAVNQINNPKVKLVVFGSVTEELKSEVEKRCSDSVQYIGWIKAEDSYEYFAASDLVVFPGRHSVFWEQVAGQGIPMICKWWEGTTHVDCGGNVLFLKEDEVEVIKNAINTVQNNYSIFKSSAEKARSTFSYKDIAKRSIK